MVKKVDINTVLIVLGVDGGDSLKGFSSFALAAARYGARVVDKKDSIESC